MFYTIIKPLYYHLFTIVKGDIMPKKTSININGGPLAAGFFSQETIKKSEEDSIQKEHDATPFKDDMDTDSKKSLAANKGGRPKKDGLKAEQYSLTMEPEKYEQLRVIAKKYTKGNFSSLIDLAVTTFCNVNHINLDEIKVDQEILDAYQKKQSKKKKK